MIKLGIVGSENFHAIAFSQLCNGGGETRVRGARVVAIWGEDVARARDVARRGKIPEVVATPEEMIGKVDAVLVVLRHGGLHARYALPFLGAGVPTWVDKPFAIDPRDTQRMLRAARRMGTPISSFSTLRYAGATQTFLREMRRRHGGAVAGTIAGASCGAGAPPGAYGGLAFYGCHVVELMNEVFGYGARDVRAVKHRGGHVQATVGFGDARAVTLQFLTLDVAPAWHVTAYGPRGSAHVQVDTSDCYRRGLEVILRMARTGKSPLTDEQLLETVRVMHAIGRATKSHSSGTRVSVA